MHRKLMQQQPAAARSGKLTQRTKRGRPQPSAQPSPQQPRLATGYWLEKAIKAASTVPRQCFSLDGIKVEMAGLMKTTSGFLGNKFALGVKCGPISAAHKAAISKANTGNTANTGVKRGPLSAARKAAISKGKTGVKLSAAHKAAISKGKTGGKLSAAHKAAISKGLTGTKRKAEANTANTAKKRRSS